MELTTADKKRLEEIRRRVENPHVPTEPMVLGEVEDGALPLDTHTAMVDLPDDAPGQGEALAELFAHAGPDLRWMLDLVQRLITPEPHQLVVRAAGGTAQAEELARKVEEMGSCGGIKSLIPVAAPPSQEKPEEEEGQPVAPGQVSPSQAMAMLKQQLREGRRGLLGSFDEVQVYGEERNGQALLTVYCDFPIPANMPAERAGLHARASAVLKALWQEADYIELKNTTNSGSPRADSVRAFLVAKDRQAHAPRWTSKSAKHSAN